MSNSSVFNSITKEEAAKNRDKLIESYDKQVESAQETLDIVTDALNNFEIYFGNRTEIEKTAKKAELEARLEVAEEAYEAAVKARESGIESAKNSYTTSTIRLSTTTEQNQVELYEDQLAEGIVKAPISGTVTAVNFDAGDTYIQGSPIVTIQDCSAFEVEAYIGEYDISDIENTAKPKAIISFFIPTKKTKYSISYKKKTSIFFYR